MANNKKIRTQDEVLRIVRSLKKRGKKIVTASGSFDIFHAGHLHLLREAKKQGDVLVVLLNSDASVRKYKGPERPIHPQMQRAEVLSALECVDYVVVFDEINPKAVLAKIQPDVHCNGSDWGKNCVERSVVEKYGGKIKVLPLRKGLSTSNLIRTIGGIHGQPPAKAIFLDRDGTINVDKGYVHKKEDFIFAPYALQALRKLSKTGYKIFIITNQSGVGRGYYTKGDLLRINTWLLKELKRKTVRIDAINHCPHRPDDNCVCRKPNIGLLLQAVAAHGVSLNDSWMVGDGEKDVVMGREANLKTIKIGKKMPSHVRLEPNYYVKNLLQAANIIIKRNGGA